MAKRLGKKEKRAKDYAERILRWTEEGGEISFVVEWRKSRTWGANPQIYWDNEGILDVSGCGYCKHSTALAQFLRWLFPADSEEHKKVWRTGGTGVPRVIQTLAELGWKLESSGSGRDSDAYTLSRIPSV